MQGLDLVSLAQLSCTNHGIAAAALHKESGRFLTQQAIRDEEFERYHLEHDKSRYDSSVFRAHIPVSVTLNVDSTKGEGLGLARAPNFRHVYALNLRNDDYAEDEDEESNDERLIRILSQPWIRLSVRQFTFDSEYPASRKLQKVICSLPRLTSLRIHGESNVPHIEALVLMTSVHTAATLITDEDSTYSIAHLISALPLLTNLSLGAHTLEKSVCEKLTSLLLPRQFLQLRTLDLRIHDSPRVSQASFSEFLVNLARLVELRINPRATNKLLQACILAGPDAMRELVRVECKIARGAKRESFARQVSPQLVAQFLERFPRVAEFHFGLGFGKIDGEVPDAEIGFVHRCFGGGNPRVTIQSAPRWKPRIF